MTKYKIAADCVNIALEHCITDLIKPGKRITDICVAADLKLEQECAKYYTKKVDGQKVEKGSSIPCCISVNEQVSYNCPDNESKVLLEEGQTVKIDIGAHIDGYVAHQAVTIIVQGENAQTQITGKQADVIKACIAAQEVAARMLRPGKTTNEISVAIEKVAKDFGVNLVEGVLSHNMKRFAIDGNKIILLKKTTQEKADDHKIELYDVFGLDIVMTTGEGKLKQKDEKETQIYKRALEKTYSLKMKASRGVFSDVCFRYPSFPFAARNLEGGNSAKAGLPECLKHDLLIPYPVLYEKAGEAVAQVKTTVLVMGKGNDRITKAIEMMQQDVSSEKALVDEELVELLKQPLKPPAKPRKKK